jgi:hypothetical protein
MEWTLSMRGGSRRSLANKACARPRPVPVALPPASSKLARPSRQGPANSMAPAQDDMNDSLLIILPFSSPSPCRHPPSVSLRLLEPSLRSVFVVRLLSFIRHCRTTVNPLSVLHSWCLFVRRRIACEGLDTWLSTLSDIRTP